MVAKLKETNKIYNQLIHNPLNKNLMELYSLNFEQIHSIMRNTAVKMSKK